MDGVGGWAGEVREGRPRTCGYVTRWGGVGESERTRSRVAGGGIQVEFWGRCKEFESSSERLGREIQMAIGGGDGVDSGDGMFLDGGRR